MTGRAIRPDNYVRYRSLLIRIIGLLLIFMTPILVLMNDTTIVIAGIVIGAIIAFVSAYMLSH